MDSELATKKDLAGLEVRLETRIVDRLTELIRDVEMQLLTSFHETRRGPGSH
jgi:hypothetical protein